MNEVELDVWAAVQAVNRAWTVDINPSVLREYFHPRMVAITPVDRLRRVGQDACVEGWQGFADAYRILWWKEEDPDIQMYGDCAVVTYYFDMEFQDGERTIRSNGRDMMVLVCEGDRWRVVADQFSPYP